MSSPPAKHFSKVLIANRGEIASRIVRTLRRLGIASVVVFHEADRDTPAVRDADEAVQIHGEPPVAAYLDAAQIVEAARKTGAQAVHPGFGFLSEKAHFAEAVIEAGLVFVGPPPSAIRAMGDKIESKVLAVKAGVPTVPGSADALESGDEAVAIADRIGYPVLLKASAGGGGKGMRIAHNAQECRDGLARASAEAKAAFGDGRVFVEKYVEEPRHIEVQVLADGFGNVVHLGERECSIQRRYQKVVEEAPSPFIDAETRAVMGEQACALARAVGYTSAGTVEMVVDRHRNFYFLEMNTRLQVEHPVTEMTTGIDIVEQQLAVAAGGKLPFTQKDVAFKGHAIEVRIYAEDADAGFIPATGRLLKVRFPHGDGIRVDHGVREGLEIGAAFDPMIAKLVAHGATRDEAVARMCRALEETVILGPITNIDFLRRVVGHPEFGAGRIHTGFLALHKESLAPLPPTPDQEKLLMIAAALAHPDFDFHFATPVPLDGLGAWSN
ncbi:acetyl-CoA carboxylase biotin carboxylase subunit [Ramlibacter sp.]|uniref:acetyl-CoA carboxylase biotin carboxylase subunit n=1 Tax=Ramlibacter sp. TaxID=1917967 RepID=UPI003D13E11C